MTLNRKFSWCKIGGLVHISEMNLFTVFSFLGSNFSVNKKILNSL